MTTTNPKDPDRRFWVTATAATAGAGLTATAVPLPVLPVWLAQFSASTDAAEVARHVGFLSGAYAAGVLIGAPLWGFVSDRIGRSRILIAGMVGYVASMLLLLLAPSWGSLWIIYALRTAAGLCVAAVIPVVPAIVAEHAPEVQRARRFAWLGAASLVGFFSDAGGAVASADLVILISATLGAAIMLGLAWTLPARPASRWSVRMRWRRLKNRGTSSRCSV